RVAPAGAVLGGRGASGGRRGQAEGRQARSAPAGVTEQEPPGTAPDPALDVSVIVPTYQRRNLVARTVAALADQTVDRDRFEVIVVVDGSTDGTADRVRALDRPVHIRVIEQRNRGRAAAINAGAAGARGPVLLFLDDDMRADPNMIAEHLRTLEEIGADA